MKKNKLLVAIALSIGLSAVTGVVIADSHMAGYDSSVEYSQYRSEKSPYSLRASDILGATLENAAGDNLGDIDDLIVSRKDNKLMAIVSVGGFLGMGDHLIAVPYENLRVGKDNENVYWDVNKASLEAMPVFTYGEGETKGYDSIMSRRMGANAPGERMGYSKSMEYSKYRSEETAYTLRVSDLLGEDVENADGDNLGEVDDLIISRDGSALQAVVSVGGFLGIGDRLITVPYQELRAAADSNELYLNTTKQALEARPEFTYNEGEITGMKILNERKRYAADVKQDVNSAVAAAGTTVVPNSFENSVSYNEFRNDKSAYNLRMSEIIGEGVKNANDEEIGEIDDLIMSRKDDSLMAIISVGGFLGIGDRLVSVPYEDLRMSVDGDDVYLNSTKAMLEAKPEFKYNEGEVFGKSTLQNKMKSAQ